MFLHSWVHSYIAAWSFRLFFFFLNQGQIFNQQSRYADLGLLSQWEVLPEACKQGYSALSWAPLSVSGARLSAGVNRHRVTRNLVARDPSLLSLASDCYVDFPFYLASIYSCPFSHFMIESQVIARTSSMRGRQSTAASSPCISICIFAAQIFYLLQQQCSAHHRNRAHLLSTTKDARAHYTLSSCMSSSLIFPSISLVRGTRVLSFLVFKRLHCSLHCQPQPRAQQLPLGQRGIVRRGWTKEAARESRGMSLESVFPCDFEKENLWPTHRVIGYRVQTVASENPDLSHGGESCCAAVLSNSSTRLTNNNN